MPEVEQRDVYLEGLLKTVTDEYNAAKLVGQTIEVEIRRSLSLESVDVVTSTMPIKRAMPSPEDDVFVGSVADGTKMLHTCAGHRAQTGPVGGRLEPGPPATEKAFKNTVKI